MTANNNLKNFVKIIQLTHNRVVRQYMVQCQVFSPLGFLNIRFQTYFIYFDSRKADTNEYISRYFIYLFNTCVGAILIT